MSNISGFDNQGRPILNTTVTNAQLAAARQVEADRVNAAVQRRLDAEAAHRAEQARIQAEAGQAALEQYREQAKAAYLAAGGGAAHWPSVWTELERKYLLEQAEAKLTFHQRTVEQTKAELKASGQFSKF